MLINSIPAYNIKQTQGVVVDNKKTASSVQFKSGAVGSENKENKRHVKAGVFLTTVLAMGAALAVISKKQGFSLSPKKISETKMKDWAIFKLPKNAKDGSNVLKIEEKEILAMAGSSVLGGLAGGAIFDDKKNMKPKLRESVNQMLGDVMVPLAFVAGPTRIYKNFKGLADKETKHLSLQKASKFINGNKFLKIFCPVIISGVSLGAGIIAGNRVSNYINEKMYKIKVDRKIKATDFAPHLDDVCLAITLMAEKSPVSSAISKLVPLALLVPGIEVGTARKGQHERV